MRRLGGVVGTVLARRAEHDRTIWVLDGDLADSDGADQFAAHHPHRFLNCGIAEQNMVSVAAGLALKGQRPFVFSFAAFLCYRAYDQIRVGVSQTGLPVTLVGSHAGGLLGRNGKTHTALNDITVMASLPKMQLWSPAVAQDIDHIVAALLAQQGPAYIRLSRAEVPDLHLPFATVRWIGKPSRVAFVTTGSATHWALAACERLVACGIEAGVLDIVRVSPIDEERLRRAAADIAVAIVVEDHHPLGGLASQLRAVGLNCSIVQKCWPADWSGQSGTDAELRAAFGLDANALVEFLLANTPC